MAVRIWNIAKGDKQKSTELAEKYSIPTFTAHLLASRGYTQPEQISELLVSDCYALTDPMGYADMDKAVRRIAAAIDKFEPIAVYGDYDADGVTATALLYSYLESCDANVLYVLPDRESGGYGLNNEVIDSFNEYGVKLIITVDNGISACDEVEYAKSLGIDTVITDHHQLPERLPDAVAVVNPHRPDCRGGFREFAGVGVAFKLVCALEGESEFILDNYADLIALGTIADVVPLVGENRVLARRGLESISRNERIGVNILKLNAGLGSGRVTASDISFYFAPRINAAGRLGKPDRAVRLLLSDDIDECRMLADELADENVRRQSMEKEIAAQIWQKLNADPSLMNDRVVVVSGEGWKKGLIGIFANRLCEALGKPCFVITTQDGVAKGSGRSVPGFSLVEALGACSDYLAMFGGHSSAAGLTLAEEDIDAFRTAINQYAADAGQMPFATIDIDCEIPLSRADIRLYRESQILEPFGAGNSVPVLCVRGCEIADIRAVGGNMHQRLTLRSGATTVTAMYFRMSGEFFHFKKGDVVDCVIELSYKDNASGSHERDNLTRIIRDMRPSGFEEASAARDERLFERHLRREELSAQEVELLLPDRECFSFVYSYLKTKGGYKGDLILLHWALSKINSKITYAKMLTVLEAMSQLGLISKMRSGAMWSVAVLPVLQKVRLEDAEIIWRLTDI